MGIPMLKIRRPVGRLIFDMGITIPSKTVFLIETAPRCPTLFSSYYHVREAGYGLRHNDRLHVPMARTDIGQSYCKIKGARLWNDKFNWLILICIKKKLQKNYHETLYWNLSLNLLHLTTVCVHALLLSWYHTYLLHKTISKYQTHWYWTTHFENVMCSTHLGTIKYPPPPPAPTPTNTLLPSSCIIVEIAVVSSMSLSSEEYICEMIL